MTQFHILILNLKNQMEEDDLHHQILIVLLGVAAASMVVVTYHCCRRATPNTNISTIQPPQSSIHEYKYTKDSVVEQEEDATCSVCLCEINEGDRVCVLPECLHLFHVQCIHLWLASHTNCPNCRAEAPGTVSVVVVPPPEVCRLPNFGG